MRKFIVISIVLLMLAGFAITSSAQPVTVTLFAGQTLLVGTLTVEVVGDNLEVTYEITEPGWELLETHLYVGENSPKKSAPGKFPYKDEEELGEGVTLVEYSILLSSFEGSVLYIAAHAELIDKLTWEEIDEVIVFLEETAWATGEEEGFACIPPCRNWAMYFTFPLPEPE